MKKLFYIVAYYDQLLVACPPKIWLNDFSAFFAPKRRKRCKNKEKRLKKVSWWLGVDYRKLVKSTHNNFEYSLKESTSFWVSFRFCKLTPNWKKNSFLFVFILYQCSIVCSVKKKKCENNRKKYFKKLSGA